MIYLLDLRRDDRGGPVVPGLLTEWAGGASGRAAEESLRQAARVAFLLHGFNVSRPSGRATLLKLATLLLAGRDHALVGVLWPGDSWARAASYSFEGRDADDSAVELVRFIDRVLRPGTGISLAAHSLGCRVALETVKRLDSRFPVAQVALMAGAVDDYGLAWSRAYRAAVSRAGRVAVLASKADDVLRLAYPVGDLLQSFVFFWREAAGLALGYHGPRAHKPTAGAIPDNVFTEQINDRSGVDHGDYLPAENPNKWHKRAASWVDAVLAGESRPTYG